MKLPINPGANPMARLPDDVCMLPQDAVVNLVGQKTNCYLLFTERGTWVVDPPSDRAEQLNEIMSAVRGPIVGLLLTHTHQDHTGGVAALVAQSGVSVYAHPKAQPFVPTHLPFMPLNEGDQLDGWQVFEVPGHRFDSLCFFSPSSGCAIVGDLVAGAGTVVLSPPEADLLDYLHSLRRLRDEIPATLLAPGHGPLIDQPKTLITHYINHRLGREQLVLRALSQTPTPLSALVPRAYPKLNPALYPLAERSLLCHLIKLQREGRADQGAAGWHNSQK
ncbi:MAG: MBL fold metallo-hydrolase [Ardenticatenaceae bacterium]